MVTRAIIRDAILRAVQDRGAGKTICPSEVARAVSDDWRALMPDVRAEAGDLQKQGFIRITQKGVPVDVTTARGPIRLGLQTGD
jgi:hypothetical protein